MPTHGIIRTIDMCLQIGNSWKYEWKLFGADCDSPQTAVRIFAMAKAPLQMEVTVIKIHSFPIFF